MTLRILTFFFLISVFPGVHAQVRLPKIISDGMVLQRDATLKIWGWAAANEKVTVKISGKSYKTKAGTDGSWFVTLPPVKAGGPYVITIAASNTITIKDVLFGDVWFCSGQSNMVHQLNIHDVTYASEIANADFPEIRQFWIPAVTSLKAPENDLPSGSWKKAVGEEVRPFSAVAYFFAKQIYGKYHIPIGIINASVGGTPIEAWTSEEGLKNFPPIQSTIQKNKDTAYINGLNRAAAEANTGKVEQQDKGMNESPKWFETTYLSRAWRTINIPGYWEDQGLKDLNGVVWYRKEIYINPSMTGKPAKVFLGRIVDADVLYINGTEVGKTTYQYPQRRYTVPAGVLKAGENLFVIRVTNSSGKGGFVSDKPYCLFAGGDTVDLKGYWQYKVGEVFEPRKGANGTSGISAQNQPTALYNAMVAPVINFSIKGFLWYQGEANTGRAEEYAKIQPAMIADWRSKWKQDNLPFLYVQLPGFMDYNYLPSESQWATLRESQLKTLSVPNTGMAVAIDLGEWNDIHPDNKKDVGERLALAAKKIAYGENIVYSGPIYTSSEIRGNEIILSFDHIGSGLMTNDGEEPGEFAIAGADKKFVWAKARIEGNTIVVSNKTIANPLYVRYAWADNPVHPNLFNREGIPASPFRTDK